MEMFHGNLHIYYLSVKLNRANALLFESCRPYFRSPGKCPTMFEKGILLKFVFYNFSLSIWS